MVDDTMKRTLIGLCVGAVMAAGVQAAPLAHAYEPGCVSQFWLYNLRGTTRTICDGPRFPDGSWKRAREFFAPERYVPVTCSWGSYGGSCYGGYTLRELNILDVYPVTDATVLPDEPGWIPS